MKSLTFSEPYKSRPWLAQYGDLPKMTLPAHPQSPLAGFRESCSRFPDAKAICYFDAELSYTQLDALSDAFAAWLGGRGVKHGERVMIALNNTPHAIIAVLGTWKHGAVPVACNPMYRQRELAALMADCTPAAVVCEHHLAATVMEGLELVGRTAALLAVDAYDFQTEDDPRALPARTRAPGAIPDFMEEIEPLVANRLVDRAYDPASGDPALVLYTSGTTGAPKGAVLSHGALAHCGFAARPWTGIEPGSRQFVIAPTFHILGIVTCLVGGFFGGDCLVMTYRFEPKLALDTIVRHKVQSIVASPTAFLALLAMEQTNPETMASLHSVYSGGAAVPPALIRAFREKTGKTIHPAFGMTETSAGVLACPFGIAVAVDPETGMTSAGIPMTGVDVMIIDDNGNAVPAGEPGELVIRSPGLMSHYLNKPDETGEALAGGWMHSGDIATMNAEGWFFIVDRKKDIINTSGYKVWPREVEECLYEHPAVFEAAVVGIDDPYRGETVKAIVSLRPGLTATTEDLESHCRDRLAPYKVPRLIDIRVELPKTATGKISRSLLRDDTSSGLARTAPE